MSLLSICRRLSRRNRNGRSIIKSSRLNHTIERRIQYGVKSCSNSPFITDFPLLSLAWWSTEHSPPHCKRHPKNSQGLRRISLQHEHGRLFAFRQRSQARTLCRILAWFWRNWWDMAIVRTTHVDVFGHDTRPKARNLMPCAKCVTTEGKRMFDTESILVTSTSHYHNTEISGRHLSLSVQWTASLGSSD